MSASDDLQSNKSISTHLDHDASPNVNCENNLEPATRACRTDGNKKKSKHRTRTMIRVTKKTATIVFFAVLTVLFYDIVKIDLAHWRSVREAQQKEKGEFAALHGLSPLVVAQKNTTTGNNHIGDPKPTKASQKNVPPTNKQSSSSNVTTTVEEIRERLRIRKRMMVNYSRPDLDKIVDPITNEIIGDPQFLLDFSIVGFGKCGTR
jgi:hypothetical protein